MASATEDDIAQLAALENGIQKAQEAVQRQGDIVRGLKAEMKEGRVVRVRVCAGLFFFFFLLCVCLRLWKKKGRGGGGGILLQVCDNREYGEKN